MKMRRKSPITLSQLAARDHLAKESLNTHSVAGQGRQQSGWPGSVGIGAHKRPSRPVVEHVSLYV
jgi:hypothetical protein